MMPNQKTQFLKMSEIEKYSDKDKYCCAGVVFSPDTENNHFHGCPPYIEIHEINGDEVFYFEVPEIVAYYAKTHPGYTMEGRKNNIKEGERLMAQKLRDLLKI